MSVHYRDGNCRLKLREARRAGENGPIRSAHGDTEQRAFRAVKKARAGRAKTVRKGSSQANVREGHERENGDKAGVLTLKCGIPHAVRLTVRLGLWQSGGVVSG